MAQQFAGRWVISPQDLIAEFECDHRTSLDFAVKAGVLAAPVVADAGLVLLQQQGLAHEQARLEGIDPGLRVKRLDTSGYSIAGYEAGWRETKAAINAEYDVIYQATLFTGDFVGFADFLVVARDGAGAVVRDARGMAVYEPVDTKSARSAKRGAVLQVGAYAEAMVRLGLPAPRQVHLWLAGDTDWSGPADKFMALASEYRLRVDARLADLGSVPSPTWAAPRESCARCRWSTWCEAGRRDARDVSLVQGIRSTTRQRLIDGGLPTIDALAVAADGQRPTRVSRDTFDRLRAQSDIQIRGERAGEVLYEITDPIVLAGLPARSPEDLWFDMEGDPYSGNGRGLEYMFGFGFLTGGAFDFGTTEAHDIATERTAFEGFIDIVMERWAADPEMHVYHYADYERRTLSRLAQQHGTREAELDLLLRAGRLVDLYSLVRRSLRFSTESLSLKYIEGVYGVSHAGGDVATAMDSVIQFERSVGLRLEGKADEADEILAGIRAYNRLDCESTMQLDAWLRSIMPPGSHRSGDPIVDPDDAPAGVDPHAAVIEALEAGVPADPAARSARDQARAMLAGALQFHPRERRPAWWQLFELIKAEIDDLSTATGVLVADRSQVGGWFLAPRARKQRREIVIASDHADPRDVFDGAGSAFLLYDQAPEGVPSPADSQRGYHAAEIESVDDEAVRLVEKSGIDDVTWSQAPIAILPGAPYNTDPIRGAIASAAGLVVAADGTVGGFPARAWADLLCARPPTRRGPLPVTGDPVDDIVVALQTTDDSYVAVQGPPGTGKTYVGSRAVARLARAGWRIGVVAQSHAVVDNFLASVSEADTTVAIGKEPQAGSDTQLPWHIRGKVHDWAAAVTGGYVIGGTAWTFARPAIQALDLDLLVIDEAGQYSLPNAIASAVAAHRVLLLGDPQQLPQVSQAAHPDGVETSVLSHVAHGAATMPADRGYFLDRTYRMHPALTRPVSVLQYEGKLGSAPVTSLRHLDGIRPGITPAPVPHTGNTTSSPEEAREVHRIAADLIGRTWTGASNDQPHPPRPITQDDVIVVAAYNAQVRLIRRTLAEAGLPDIKVGTVDKFQGREEVAVIVSMATSSAEELPRGLEFLLSPNRLNVAISRAQWAAFLVHSPALRDIAPPSVEGMQRLGGFLQLLDPAEES